MNHTEYRVVPDGECWQVRRDGEMVSRHETRDDAVAAGRLAARGEKPSSLHIQDRPDPGHA
ncbi:MAG: DUF2188 domain-containing protein [Hamadaea sp.]|uniref:DUF2188 domain-containing protein n=1 Tax=Hamadaea sp. TaxID=2024425 RepID=UPI0017F64EFE|nr:DUF2188 domain-containing protein [Hamadaea sp.]NUR71787.1 DUF2188 domain-containing protein [Hamadaea sp.]NUT23913.1 DUF2188 domain-containing protein [Hamadaea sp.]